MEGLRNGEYQDFFILFYDTLELLLEDSISAWGRAGGSRLA
jgi:hypothetical protein